VKILVVTPELPASPRGSGGQVRMFELLRAVAARHEVAVVTAVRLGEEADVAALKGFARVIAVHDPRANGGAAPPAALRTAARSRWRALGLAALGLASPLPEAIHWYEMRFGRALRAAVRRERRENPPDLIQVEQTFGARLVLPALGDEPRVIDAMDVIDVVARDRATAAAGPIDRLRARTDAIKTRGLERAVLPRFDAVAAMSEADAPRLERLGARRVVVVPNGADVDRIRPAAAPPAAPPEVLFVGSLLHPPNREGLAWFLREVLPLVRARRPEVRLVAIGRGFADHAQGLEAAGAQLVGEVPDTAPFLARASVVIVPILSGSGTRLKLAEAWAAGRPVVATARGAEGYDFTPGEHALVADAPAAFADAILRLLDDGALAARLGAAGRALVEARYSWQAAAAAAERLYAAALDARARR
jgi:glycosyltransferase involved in cell wall biosynthesis